MKFRLNDYNTKDVMRFLCEWTELDREGLDKLYDEMINIGLKEYIDFKHKYEFWKEENLLEFMRKYKK